MSAVLDAKPSQGTTAGHRGAASLLCPELLQPGHHALAIGRSCPRPDCSGRYRLADLGKTPGAAHREHAHRARIGLRAADIQPVALRPGPFPDDHRVEIGVLAPILTGVLLAVRGWPALRAFWLALLFIAFLMPLPGIFVDALTAPLKQNVSEIAEQLLYTTGYPIARNGLVLIISQYQLLVADACSGLNSMFSLSALGLLYLYLMRYKSWLHNGLLLASILPIAFCANIVRMMILILVIYHFGDEAGQDFLHGVAGIVPLMVALILLLLDAILARVIKPRNPA